MSLINDALQRARQEAARRDAARRGLPLPPSPPTSRPSGLAVAVAALALALVASVAALFVLYRQGQTPTPEALIAAPPPAVEISRETPPSTPAPGSAEPVPRAEEVPAAPPETTAESSETETETPLPARQTPPSPSNSVALAAAQVLEGFPCLNVRVEPVVSANVVACLDPGQMLDILVEDGDWLQVRVADGREGWAMSRFVRVLDEEAEPSVRPLERRDRLAALSAAGENVPPASPARRQQGGERISGGEAPATEETESQQPGTESFVRQAVLEDGASIELGGIAWSEEGPYALLNGSVVGIGEPVEGYTVLRIEPHLVELIGKEGNVVIRLK